MALASVSLVSGCSRVAPASWRRARRRRVGFLNQASASQGLPPGWAAWRDQLAALGWIEGENLVVEWRHADDSEERLPEMAVGLVRAGVDVIYAWTVTETIAALAASSSIPVVGASDTPLHPGMSASPPNPGGNFTGVLTRDVEANVKRIELLKLCVPGLRHLALIKPSRGQNTPMYFAHADAIIRATEALGITMSPMGFGDVDDSAHIEGIVSQLMGWRPDALYVAPSMMFATREASTRIANLAIRHELPTVANNVTFTQAGLLLAHGANEIELRRRSAALVDKVLRGANPTDLPIERASRFDLGVNLKTAAVLGVTIPQSVVDQATYLIQ